MKLFAFTLALGICTTAWSRDGQPFACTSGINEGGLVSLNGCVDKKNSRIATCKNQDPVHLGTPYLTLKKVVFERGNTIAAPVIEKVLIPASHFVAQISKTGLEFSLDKSDIGFIELKAPSDLSTSTPRIFNVQVKGIEHRFTAVICNYL